MNPAEGNLRGVLVFYAGIFFGSEHAAPPNRPRHWLSEAKFRMRCPSAAEDEEVIAAKLKAFVIFQFKTGGLKNLRSVDRVVAVVFLQ
jgi:hypothetical protein